MLPKTYKPYKKTVIPDLIRDLSPKRKAVFQKLVAKEKLQERVELQFAPITHMSAKNLEALRSAQNDVKFRRTVKEKAESPKY